jgi:hypothetical protein
MDTSLKWVAPARLYKPRDRQFFTTAIAIAVLVGIILAFAGEWMLIMVMVAMFFAYYVWSTVPPENTEYEILDRGVKIHGQLYKWEELNQWWLEEKWGQRVLTFDAPLVAGRRLHMVLDPIITSEQIARAIGANLIEERPADTTMDRAGRWLSEKFPLEAK